MLHSEKKKMIRRGMDWNKMLRFTVPMHGEARYNFDYLTSTYDSVHGEVIKVAKSRKSCLSLSRTIERS